MTPEIPTTPNPDRIPRPRANRRRLLIAGGTAALVVAIGSRVTGIQPFPTEAARALPLHTGGGKDDGGKHDDGGGKHDDGGNHNPQPENPSNGGNDSNQPDSLVQGGEQSVLTSEVTNEFCPADDNDNDYNMVYGDGNDNQICPPRAEETPDESMPEGQLKESGMVQRIKNFSLSNLWSRTSQP